jgi:hypothetical protein
MSKAQATAAAILEGLAPALGAGLVAIPVAGPIVGPAVTAALGLAADLLRRGLDVPITIERIRRSPEVLGNARAETRWSEAIERRFAPVGSEPPDSTVPEPGPLTERHPTLPSMPAVTSDDIYYDLGGDEEDIE